MKDHEIYTLASKFHLTQFLNSEFHRNQFFGFVREVLSQAALASSPSAAPAPQEKTEPIGWFDAEFNNVKWREGIINSDIPHNAPLYLHAPASPSGSELPQMPEPDITAYQGVNLTERMVIRSYSRRLMREYALTALAARSMPAGSVSDEELLPTLQEIDAIAQDIDPAFGLPLYTDIAVPKMLAALRTLLAGSSHATVPPGYAIVPLEPTEEMLTAAAVADGEYSKRTFGDGVIVYQGGYDHWKAMIAAAPLPKEEGETR